MQKQYQLSSNTVTHLTRFPGTLLSDRTVVHHHDAAGSPGTTLVTRPECPGWSTEAPVGSRSPVWAGPGPRTLKGFCVLGRGPTGGMLHPPRASPVRPPPHVSQCGPPAPSPVCGQVAATFPWGGVRLGCLGPWPLVVGTDLLMHWWAWPALTSAVAAV